MLSKTTPLSVTSRILVAFASGALVAAFFLPAWQILLFAPQYPEGLKMNIWINKLTGNIDIINGLNHYIGMKPFSEADFPEFAYLPYVVGFFMLLGMLVAITGNRRFLFLYLLLTILGGALALYDFYMWEYKYGHNLNPEAPIQVPGMSYQPPLFGHKRLLNFDAYSFPDVGGWVVIGAAAVAFLVWFFEWYKQRRSKKKNISAALLLIPVLFFSSCSAQPEPFKYGTDNCYACKMGVMDPKFGGEIITSKGKVYKFDDVICLVRFLKSDVIKKEDIKQNVVINFKKENDFIDVTKATFFISNDLKSPMGSNAAAFTSDEEANTVKNKMEGQLMKWDEVYKKIQ
jgi:copper chaperone NosL